MKIILLISFAFVVENAKFAVKIKKERPLCEKIILDSYIIKSYEKCGFSENFTVSVDSDSLQRIWQRI